MRQKDLVRSKAQKSTLNTLTSMQQNNKDANAATQPEGKKFLSKKERIAKKEEERRARQQQERDSMQMGVILSMEMSEYNFKQYSEKRRRSMDLSIGSLDGKRNTKLDNLESPSMSKLIVHGTQNDVPRFDRKQTKLTIDNPYEKVSLKTLTPSIHQNVKTTYLDWRATYEQLSVTEDSKENIALAKGKEIKRPKEETRQICLAFINEFLKDGQNAAKKQEVVEEFQKETFWQRVGFQKIDKEKPLFGLGKDKLD